LDVALLSAYPAQDSPAEARMRARSWLAVSAGTLTGSALAITGNPQSRATPAATTAHLRDPEFHQDSRKTVTGGTRRSDDPYRPDTQ